MANERDNLGVEAMAEAADAVAQIVDDRIVPAAAAIEDAFADAAQGLAREMENAARSGEVSFRRLGRTIVASLAGSLARSAARWTVEKTLGAAFGGLASGPVSGLAGQITGVRADGGLIAPGRAYLVGERGPELIAPAGPGRVSPAVGAPINVTIALPGVVDAPSFAASETQIAAALARALAKGGRNQ